MPARLGVTKRNGGGQEQAQGGQELLRCGFVWVVAGTVDLDQTRVGQPGCEFPMVVRRNGSVFAAPREQDRQVGELRKGGRER